MGKCGIKMPLEVAISSPRSGGEASVKCSRGLYQEGANRESLVTLLRIGWIESKNIAPIFSKKKNRIRKPKL